MTNTTTRILSALQDGQELTGKQIAARFGVTNPRDAIYNLRREGYAIYLNKHKDTKGRVTHKYRLGAPSKRLVAAGYRALAAGI